MRLFLPDSANVDVMLIKKKFSVNNFIPDNCHLINFFNYIFKKSGFILNKIVVKLSK